MGEARELQVKAIEVTQGPRRTLYSFAINGKDIPKFATIYRIRRAHESGILGYQRPEVRSHIDEIRRYLESESPMLPNAIVIAFDERVKFEPSSADTERPSYSRTGTLSIPIDDSLAPEAKPGFIVDGQQRLAAIREASVQFFPICVTAFITRSVEEQTEQFILINSAKPLPKGLIYELLPGTSNRLPTQLERRRLPAYLMERLNHDEESPLNSKIRTVTNPSGVVKDTSILKMLENSLTDGVLYCESGLTRDVHDVERMLVTVKNFWNAVRDVFDDAWGLPPRRSRLLHGAGVVSLGYLMDAIGDRHRGFPCATGIDATQRT